MSTLKAGIAAVFCFMLLIMSLKGNGDYMEPPGPPGSEEARFKTLDQVEPRVHISQLPYTITNPGSYYMTCSLEGSSNNHGIIIASCEVQIDLNGFLLEGGSNTLNGIYVVDPATCEPPEPDMINISIYNGFVENWGGQGLCMSNAWESRLIGLSVFENGGSGITIGGDCQLKECVASDNTGVGIQGGEDLTVIDCRAFENTDAGIIVGMATRVSGCTMAGNGGNGLQTAEGATVSDCKAAENGGSGIVLGPGSHIQASTSVENTQNGIVAGEYCAVRDCLAVFNTNNGIVASSSCMVVGNNCGENASVSSNGAGILVSDNGNRVENNNLTANWTGIEVRGSGNFIGNNTIIDSSYRGIIATNSGNFIARNIVGSEEVGSTNYQINVSANQVGDLKPVQTGNLTSNFNPDAWCNFQLMAP